MTTIRVCLVLLAAWLALPWAHAKNDPPFLLDSTTFRKLTRVPPYRATFPNGTTFRMPDQLRFITPDKLEEFCERMKLVYTGDELGAVIAVDMSWFTIFHDLREDPLEGMDRDNLDKTALMAWSEKFTSDHSPRMAGKDRLWRIVNWTNQPLYDPDRKILTLSIRLTAEPSGTKDLKNFKQILYGPDGQMLCLETFAPITNWEKPIQQARNLVEEITFPESYAELTAEEEMMYYAKMVGGGLLGSFLVFVAARAMFGKKRRPPAPHRITLPR